MPMRLLRLLRCSRSIAGLRSKSFFVAAHIRECPRPARTSRTELRWPAIADLFPAAVRRQDDAFNYAAAPRKKELRNSAPVSYTHLMSQ